MQTRSMTKRVQFIVDIDFDEASEAWKLNKVNKGNGTYGYKCGKILRNGNSCSHICSPWSDFCKRHQIKSHK